MRRETEGWRSRGGTQKLSARASDWALEKDEEVRAHPAPPQRQVPSGSHLEKNLVGVNFFRVHRRLPPEHCGAMQRGGVNPLQVAAMILHDGCFLGFYACQILWVLLKMVRPGAREHTGSCPRIMTHSPHATHTQRGHGKSKGAEDFLGPKGRTAGWAAGWDVAEELKTRPRLGRKARLDCQGSTLAQRESEKGWP